MKEIIMNKELQENVEQNFNNTKAVLAIILGVILVILAGEISSLVYKFSLPPTLSPMLYSALYILHLNLLL
jgi:hypothetical protein